MMRNLRLSLKSSFVLLILMLSLSSSVFAYSYYGSVLGFFKIDGGVSSGYYHNAASNLTYSNKSYNLQTAFSSALSIWNSDTEANLLPLPSGSTTTPKITAFSTNFPEYPNLFGWATMYKNGANVNPLMGEGAPTNSWDKAYAFLNVVGLHLNNIDTYTDYKAIAFHEIGHALGLNHFTGLPSIMDDTTGSNGKKNIINNGWTVPQSDDINGINNLY